MLSLIAIFLFVLSQFVYDYQAVGDSTNWSIFYFSTTYISFAMVAFDIICRETSKAIRYTAVSMLLYFVFLIVFEMTFFNVPFEEYMTSVNNTDIAITSAIVLSFILIFITVTAWEKRLSKR